MKDCETFSSIIHLALSDMMCLSAKIKNEGWKTLTSINSWHEKEQNDQMIKPH